MSDKCDELIKAVSQAIYDASGQPLCGVDKYSDHIHAAAYEKCAHAAISTLIQGSRLPGGLIVAPVDPTDKILRRAKLSPQVGVAIYAAIIAAISEE